jgi:hypothetical protein
MKRLEEVPESVKDLLRMSRGSMEMFESTQKQIVNRLLSEHVLQQRVERLLSIRGVGPITALTWALEVSDPHRFSSIGDAVSYCGLTAAFRSSAGKEQRGPISKQRNAWRQTVLIEAAKLAPRWNPQLATLHARQLEIGHSNRATLQVARKLIAYLLAVDKSGQPFQVLTPPPTLENATKAKRRKRASITKPLSGRHTIASICQRSTGRSSRYAGLCTGAAAPHTPYRLFRGRPVRTHSIFAASAYSALFPQMDVWPRCLRVGLVRGSRTVRYAKALPVGRTPSAKSEGISVSR